MFSNLYIPRINKIIIITTTIIITARIMIIINCLFGTIDLWKTTNFIFSRESYPKQNLSLCSTWIQNLLNEDNRYIKVPRIEEQLLKCAIFPGSTSEINGFNWTALFYAGLLHTKSKQRIHKNIHTIRESIACY